MTPHQYYKQIFKDKLCPNCKQLMHSSKALIHPSMRHLNCIHCQIRTRFNPKGDTVRICYENPHIDYFLIEVDLLENKTMMMIMCDSKYVKTSFINAIPKSFDKNSILTFANIAKTFQ